MEGTPRPPNGGRRGANGESVGIDLTQKSVWITAKELVSILFIVMIGLLLFVGQKGNRESQARIFLEVVQFREVQQEIKTLLTRNNGDLKDRLEQQNAHLEQEMASVLARLEALGHMVIIHEHNKDRPPGEQLPLTLPPELMPKR